jgi:MYXO-CTERM domain-containing protein
MNPRPTTPAPRRSLRWRPLAIAAAILSPQLAHATPQTDCQVDSRTTYTVETPAGAVVSYDVLGVFVTSATCDPALYDRSARRDADEDGYGPAVASSCCFSRGPSAYTIVSTVPHLTGFSTTLLSAEVDCDDTQASLLAAVDWYTDADNDGFGTGAPTRSCTQPPNTADNALDCNDAVVSAGGVFAYPDLDGDGQGDASSAPVLTCVALGAGMVANAGDCNDRDAGVSSMMVEICDGVDTDCSEGGAAPSSEQDDDGDGFVECTRTGATPWRGRGAAPGGGDCDDTLASVYPGAAEACDGVYNDCSTPTEPWSTAIGPANERDSDGDGQVECDRASTTPWLATTAAGAALPAPTGGCDCDDLDDATYTGASEVCDGQYNECGSRPSNPVASCPSRPSAGPQPADERDDDSDGYVECVGPVSPWAGARAPLGGGDCDDTSVSTHPNAAELCDGINNTCDGTGVPDDEVDDDGDRYVECDRRGGVPWLGTPINGGWDCDDLDPLVHPGIEAAAPLVCMRDLDGDGYGDSNVDEEPDPTSDTPPLQPGDDCDDTDPFVNPDAVETCDTVGDDDCDGSPNSQGGGPIPLSSTEGTQELYLDNDGDGFGQLGGVVFNACLLTPGFSPSASDCNDGNAEIYPGHAELCNLVDDDCDGNVDEPESLDADPLVSGCIELYRDQDGDFYGDRETSACICLNSGDSVAYADGFAYVQAPGDCDDGDDRTHPLSCNDGIDNDLDGLIDGLDPGDPTSGDPDCLYGLNEAGTEVELPLEYLDGNDNDCDGRLPVVELDCDDDGSMPRVPQPRPWVTQASQLGLTDCDSGLPDGAPDSALRQSLVCWDNTELDIRCDRETGLWTYRYDLSDDGNGGRYEQGRRIYVTSSTCSREGDCDDHCASRCPGQLETCDGIDNDCSDILSAALRDDQRPGVPAALDPDTEVPGTVSSNELDLDGDAFVNCNDFLSNDVEVYRTGASCAQALADEALLTDCNDLCVFTTPVAEERCNSFLDLCDSPEPEGVDRDGDGFRTCGAFSAVDGDELAEDIFLIVWADIEASSAEPDPLIDTAAVPDTAVGFVEDQRAEVVPLIPPRPDPDDPTQPVECDIGLYESLFKRLAIYEADGGTPDEVARTRARALLEGIMSGDRDPGELLRICPETAVRGTAPAAAPGSCYTVRLTLRSTTDDDLYDRFLVSVRSRSAISEACEPHAEQFISRAVWTQARIEASRRITVEWGCYALFGRSCAESSAKIPIPGLLARRALNTEVPSLADQFDWWQELLRYDPTVITNGSVVSCWGDPTTEEGLDGIESAVGGDCNDESPASNRDGVEGPGDMLGWFTDQTASCETCLDGIDNNCDGLTDCEDPACAACFVGQGMGCGGGKESTCRGNGCAAGAPDAHAPWRRWPAAALGLLAALAVRRRRSLA